MRKTFLLLPPPALALLAALLVLPLTPAGANEPDSGEAAGAERNPVLFVHGVSSTKEIWIPMIRDFRAAGYRADELRSFSYNFFKTNAITAGIIEDEVDALLRRTGASKVDIVAHSMGGLSTRWYLTKLGGVDKVDDFVSIASPHHGTALARPCRALSFTSASLSCRETARGSFFTTELNRAGETPGDVNYVTMTSSCDEIVFPHATSTLAGARNINVGCLEHGLLPTFPRVRRLTIDAVR